MSEESGRGDDHGGRFGRTPYKPEDLKDEYGTVESGRLDVTCPQCFRDWYPSSKCCINRYTGSPFCPDCGADFRASTLDFEPEWPVGVGAVLYGPDGDEEFRDLWHVTERFEAVDGETKLVMLWDGTHTSRRYVRAEDLLADYTPAGWSWPTGKKPLYHLTRQCGADDRADLMTDGGQPADSGRGGNHVLDLFAGLGGFSAAFEESDDWTVTTVEIEEEFQPDVQADVLDLRPSDLPDADLVLASPPCTAFSMAASGTHLDAEGRPVSEWGAESLTLVHHTVGLIQGLNPEWYFIENPMGGMRRVLGRPDAHVWWCQYGSDRAKPTDLWGRIPPSFDARRCHNGNDDCHHEPAPRGSDSGTQASDRSTAERAKLPFGLSASILEAVENPRNVVGQATLEGVTTVAE